MIRRRSVALAAALGTAVALTVSGAPVAQAYQVCKADYQCIDWYYSTGTYTTLVGSTYYFCNGTTTTTGEVTAYVKVQENECTG